MLERYLAETDRGGPRCSGPERRQHCPRQAQPGVGEHEQATAALSKAPEHRVDRSQRVAQSRPFEPDASGPTHHPASVGLHRNPEQVEGQSAPMSGEPDTDASLDRPDARRSFEGTDDVPEPARQPSGKIVETNDQSHGRELAPPVTEHPHAAGEVEREPETGERQREVSDLEGTDFHRLVELDTEHPPSHREPQRRVERLARRSGRGSGPLRRARRSPLRVRRARVGRAHLEPRSYQRVRASGQVALPRPRSPNTY